MTSQEAFAPASLDPAPVAPALESRSLAGYTVSTAHRDAVLDTLVAGFRLGLSRRVAFFNSNLVVASRDAGIEPAALDGFLVLNDGLAASLACRVATGRFFAHNLNGTDLVPALLARLPRDARVFLHGGRPGVSRRAGERIAEALDVTICGWAPGYGHDPAAVAAAAREAGADVVLVALGNPLQERWIAEHGGATGARLLIGGRRAARLPQRRRPARAPWVRRLRAEWLFRMAREPRRLTRRYTYDMARFLSAVLRSRPDRQSPVADA